MSNATRWKTSALLLALQCAGGSLLAQRQGIEQLFPERPSGYLTDQAGVVPSDRARAIEATIERLRQATGAEIAVVTLPTIGDYDRADVAVAIGRRWGVGAAAEQGDPRRNAGIVVLVVPKTDTARGQIFIATGRGVEGYVTDLVTGRIRDEMRDYFVAGDYGQGLEVGVAALAAVVARGLGITDSALVSGDRAIRQPATPEGGTFPGWAVIVLLVIVILFMGRLRRAGLLGPIIAGMVSGRRGGDWNIWGGGGFGGGDGGDGGSGGFGGFGGGGGFSGGGAGGDF